MPFSISPSPLFKEHPSAGRVLLLDAGLRPVAHAVWENRLQPRPLRRGERYCVIRGRERLELALDNVGSDAGSGHFAGERVGRIERPAGRGRPF